MNAGQILNKLDWASMNSELDRDTRRMMHDEATSLRVAIQRRDGVKEAMDEAVRVAKMWKVFE